MDHFFIPDWWRFGEVVQFHTKTFNATIGYLWLLNIAKVRNEEKILGGTSKELIGVYNMFCIIIAEIKICKPFIILVIFSFSEIKDTGIPIHIWGEENIG